MYFNQIEAKGLAHFSYMVGDKNEIAVIDPRRDVSVYLDIARENDLRIRYILETHRNEDYIVGSNELSEKTGAEILISGHEDLGHTYGKKIEDGHTLELGDIKIVAIHTPGHTKGHMSYALYEDEKESPYMVFTGDSLFMGDLGRTDFYGEDELENMTGQMYETVFDKLYSLGDEVLVFPAHGAGSACGENMDERPYTTIGYERKYNRELQVKSKEEFIESFARMRIKPRYFDKMEKYNLGKTEFLGSEIDIRPIWFKDLKGKDTQIVDIRTKESFAGGHIPDSLYFSVDNLASFLGTILDPETDITVLVEEGQNSKVDEIYWICRRMGFDNISGFLAEGLEQWEASGGELYKLGTINARKYMEDIRDKEDHILLDVRKPDEIGETHILENAENIPLQELYLDWEKVDRDKKVYVLCGTAERSMTSASFLKSKGIDVCVISGGLRAIKML